VIQFRSLLPIAAVPVALAVAACGTGAVSSDELEKTVTTKLKDQVGVAPKSVSCPDEGLEAKVGAKVTCELTAPNGDKVDVFLTATKVDGSNVNFDFKVDTKVKKAATS
jgi:galactitol-specific phosphotransferase system IIB component